MWRDGRFSPLLGHWETPVSRICRPSSAARIAGCLRTNQGGTVVVVTADEVCIVQPQWNFIDGRGINSLLNQVWQSRSMLYVTIAVKFFTVGASHLFQAPFHGRGHGGGVEGSAGRCEWWWTHSHSCIRWGIVGTTMKNISIRRHASTRPHGMS